MANGWLRSLQCKSRAFEDIYHPTPKHLNHLLPTLGCRKSVQNLKDIVETKEKKKLRKTNPPTSTKSSSRNPQRHTRNEPGSTTTNRVRPSRRQDSFFPSLTELPESHQSRNVVEIIFHTSWSPDSFPGRIEMIFKVQNQTKTVNQFEEYREMVKTRANRDDDARCVADGNEVMRFHCLGPTVAGIYDAGGMCTFSGIETAICTFSGSGGAHESVGGGKGRRAMTVCRVIAGKVCKKLGLDSFLEGRRDGFDSASGDNGELLVFDSRAVLPCFLIIYKL